MKKIKITRGKHALVMVAVWACTPLLPPEQRRLLCGDNMRMELIGLKTILQPIGANVRWDDELSR
jgi:hypothetical protein